MQDTKRSGHLVLPGEKLGVIEEFVSSDGTYVEDGSIYSRVVGRVLMDLMNKNISVYPLARGSPVPRAGSIVTGSITSVHDMMATLRAFKIGTRYLSGFFSGLIHISDASFRYIDSMFDVCRMGDLARAKVISDKNGAYHLTLKGQNLGVLYAFCSGCGHILTKKRADMACENCGNIEKRKTVIDYGKSEI
jgi:exosome complex component CSL4